MAETAPAVPAVEVLRERRRLPYLLDVFNRLIREKPLATVGLVMVAAMFFTGVFADLLAPYGFNETHLDARLHTYSGQYWLGTDALGRDMLSRVVYGARISMYVGLGVSFLGGFGATVLGIISGYYGGKLDAVVQRFVDAWMCFPWLVILLTIMAILGPGLFNVIFALSLGMMFYQSRVVRGAVIGIKQSQYMEAAQAIGASDVRILIQYVLPNVMAPIIIIITVYLGQAILSEAAISFLGFGIPPPEPSWGGMLSGTGRYYMYTAPWLAIWPGVALSIAVFGFNMMGDGLRDILDPRLRGAGRGGF